MAITVKKVFLYMVSSLSFLVSCSCGDQNEPKGKTCIVFDNTRGICPAIVYADLYRGDKIAEIPAGARSAEIECMPDEFAQYYFSYTLNFKDVDGLTLDYVSNIAGKDREIVRVDAGKTTVLHIPRLDEAVSSPDDLLSNDTYLLIQNGSFRSCELARGNSLISRYGFPGSTVANAGEKTLYKITPGTVSAYSIFVNWENKQLPNSPIDNFKAGRIYSFVFNGDVQPGSELIMNTANVSVVNPTAGKSSTNSFILAKNIWSKGESTKSNNFTQWFQFTATDAAIHFIHFRIDSTVSSLNGVSAQVYDSKDNAVAAQLVVEGLYRITLTAGQTYHVKASSIAYSGSGTYSIAFNDSILPPGPATDLTTGTWSDGEIKTPGASQWFYFTATAATQYIYVDFVSLLNVTVEIYNSYGTRILAGSPVTTITNFYSLSLSLATTGEYYIRVRGFNQNNSNYDGSYTDGSYTYLGYNYSGTYKIALTTTAVIAPPRVLPTTGVTELTADSWANGNAGGEQWFGFTATAATQYIHLLFTMNHVRVRIHDADGYQIGKEQYLFKVPASTSFAPIIGNIYYIQVRTFDQSGAYRIAFNASASPPF